MIYTTAIIGAGAAGLMAAAHLPSSVAVVDHNGRMGEKLRVTGGGKCNITNETVTPTHFRGDTAVVEAVLREFSPGDLKKLLTQSGVRSTRKNAVVPGQYFLSSADEAIRFFRKKTSHATFYFNRAVKKVEKKDHFIIHTTQKPLYCKNLIVASGGLAWPHLGVSPVGYDIARAFGHRIITPAPALTGFTLLPPQKWLTTLSGLSLEAEITVGKKILRGNILCAHRGLTGPAAMNASLYWEKGPIHINFLPATPLSQCISKAGNRSISTALPLPKRFVKAFLHHHGMEDIPLRSCGKKEREILSTLHRFSFSPAGVFGYRRAEVTRGGVCPEELTPHLESRRVPGLFFAGEVLDVTGQLGGYNLQWAFSSGVVCARKINEQISGTLQR
ncbi:NAD(P)/FAD-dependent oxidoreductase [Chitinivibrio alkaliphilus]|uniref:Aminoacetone oxidase family FAD-binding enzyme n=1 Tax=Chitinivibrio alkaliphilus ACht1 TaxID=1313304 RepID=U7DCW2_9BACT|nr:aminoacetone oxidase family FAD-binding enzyme [Chitinivibrio alkaliphilus]ERP39408.1 hypothetical protein CALK_0214 [Chitinivibrio alkaliphilus ACht1]